jgi:hypothetical protein
VGIGHGVNPWSGALVLVDESTGSLRTVDAGEVTRCHVVDGSRGG